MNTRENNSLLDLLLKRSDVRKSVEILPLEIVNVNINELAYAVPRATKKLDYIIEREGTLDGKRIEPRYIMLLIAEFIKSYRIQSFTFEQEKRRRAEAHTPFTSTVHSLSQSF